MLGTCLANLSLGSLHRENVVGWVELDRDYRTMVRHNLEVERVSEYDCKKWWQIIVRS